MISMQQGIDPSQVLSKIAQQDALILWVVDLFDFEANLLPGIARHLPGKDIRADRDQARSAAADAVG